jgi:hypothetical protein
VDRKPVDGAKAARSGLGVEDLREDVARLSPDEFVRKHGVAFLLLSSAGFRRPKNVSSTEVHLLDVDAEVAERTAGVSVEIVPIRNSQNSLTHLITVGRAANNDVAITDISVSRFHAFFKRSPSGGLQLHDAGSSNGTVVNGFSVCTKEAGPAMDVLAGDSIRFGQVDSTYLDAAALRSFIEKFGD